MISTKGSSELIGRRAIPPSASLPILPDDSLMLPRQSVYIGCIPCSKGSGRIHTGMRKSHNGKGVIYDRDRPCCMNNTLVNEIRAIVFDRGYHTMIFVLNQKTIEYRGFSLFQRGTLKKWIGLKGLLCASGASSAKIGFQEEFTKGTRGIEGSGGMKVRTRGKIEGGISCTAKGLDHPSV